MPRELYALAGACRRVRQRWDNAGTTTDGDAAALTWEKALRRRLRFLEVHPSSIRDDVHAFDRERRFVDANPAMLALISLAADEVIGRKLGISPRTVERHRAQVMSRLNAANLAEPIQIALAAGIAPVAQAPAIERIST